MKPIQELAGLAFVLWAKAQEGLRNTVCGPT
jgi:hypothetical protein